MTLIPALCGISSALLQYFLLVFFAWTSVEAVWLYLKLVKIFGIQSIESRFFMTASLLSWSKLTENEWHNYCRCNFLFFIAVPLLIVGLSSGAGYSYYISKY